MDPVLLPWLIPIILFLALGAWFFVVLPTLWLLRTVALIGRALFSLVALRKSEDEAYVRKRVRRCPLCSRKQK